MPWVKLTVFILSVHIVLKLEFVICGVKAAGVKASEGNKNLQMTETMTTERRYRL